jgi:hypothetical protein
LLEEPESLIVAEAGQWDADLIVLGSHGRKGFNRLLLGSVSEGVALHAGCSVDVVRATAARSRVESPALDSAQYALEEEGNASGT